MQIPTLKSLYDDVVNDLENEVNINIPVFGKAAVRGIAAVWAAKLWFNYARLARLERNVFPDLAEPEAQGGTLERFGRVKLKRNPSPARAAEYDVDITGQAGSTIEASTTFKADDSATNSGILYVLDSAHTLSGTGEVTETITLRALTPGLDGKQSIGDTLTSTTPISGVNEQVTITAETIAPLSAEGLEVYRNEILQSFRLEPQGGAAADFRLWSFDADGIRTSYPYTKVNDATKTNVEIFVEALPANTDSGQLQGTPPQAMIDEVEDVIELDPDTSKPNYKRGRVPLHAFIWEVKAVDVLEVEIIINGFDDPGNHQAEIKSAIEERLYHTRPFVAAIESERERQDTISTNNIIFEIQNINPRIRITGGVTLNVGTQAGISSYTFGVDRQNGIKGEIPVLNSITFN
jgi:uncharacterized phage protein gp47/JayE